MKYILAIISIIFLFLTTNLFAYHQSFLNLVAPSELGDLQTEIGIAHRFYGAYDDKPLDNFFGLDNGANVSVFLRQALLYKTELKLAYIRLNKEYTIDVTNRFTPDEYPVQAQANIGYFSFVDPFDIEKRHKNLMFSVAVQNKPLLNRIVFNTNLGYDSEYDRIVNGFGIGINATDKMTFLGEYYPVWDRDSAPQNIKILQGKYDCYSMGIKLDTYGHQFMFMLSNNEKMTPKQLSMGTIYKKDLKIGFNIQRKMEFF